MSQLRQEVFERRRSAFCELLSKRGIQKAIVGQPLTLYYLTGVMFHPYERVIVLCADIETSQWRMLLPSLEMGHLSQTKIEEVIYADSEDPAIPLGSLIETNGLIGVEMDYFPMRIGEIISRSNPHANMCNISEDIASMRLCKDEAEILLTRQAVQCAESALRQVIPTLRPGMTEKDILFALFACMSKMPGVIIDTFIIQILAGERAANPHGVSENYVVKKGDGITIDFGAYYEFYWSDITRNVFIGRPQPKMEEIYHIVREAHETAIAMVKPGIPACEIDLAARSVIEKAGYGEYFIHRTGHGIGLEIHEAPSVHANNPALLEPGMIFTVEPGIYIPGLGGVRIEDDILVTKTGYEDLMGFTKDFDDMIIHV